MVYALLAAEMAPGGIHALSIYAKTPAEEANT
jgi:stress-induced morphogen